MGSMFSLKTCSGQSSKFVSHRVRMSGRFDSRKHSHSTKLEQIPQMAVGTDFHAQHGTETILVFLPADGEVATSKFGFLTIRWYSATRKHLFLYPQR